MTASRPCNMGPVPFVDEAKLTHLLKVYIDSTPRDDAIFEWGILAGCSKGCTVPYQGIADMSMCIAAHIEAAPACRFNEAMLKRAYSNALAAKNTRSIFANTPRTELIKNLYRTVAMGSICWVFFLLLKFMFCLQFLVLNF